uniref:Protein kinase domain-containing protein n=1 Tax=Trichuris muris TaxID=70415 RepID=A0A5S6R021_TRIMR
MTSSSEGDMLLPGQVIRGHWKIACKIGGGGFGEIYEALDCQNNNEQVAVKVESSRASKQVLKMEVAVLRRLQGKKHACRFFGCGRNEKFNYLVMSLQGRNLADLRRETPRQCFSISTGVRLALQVLKAIEDIHSVGFLHRDIKPSNFAIGRTQSTNRIVFMLDYGLARQFLNPKGELRSPRSAAGFRGTVRYASLTAHENKEMGRHDDLWSLFYMIIEFLHGSLPWRKVKDKEEVGRLKHELGAVHLTEGLPPELREFSCHLEKLGYGDTPDYEYLSGCLRRIIGRCKVGLDDPYDWEIVASDRSLSTSVPMATISRKVGMYHRPLIAKESMPALNGDAFVSPKLKTGQAEVADLRDKQKNADKPGAAAEKEVDARVLLRKAPGCPSGRAILGRASSDVTRGEFFRHLQVETSVENDQPVEHTSDQEVNVEFNMPLPSRMSSDRAKSLANVQISGTMLDMENGSKLPQETIPRAASTPRMLRAFCRKKSSKTRPPMSTEVSCTQFAVAEDDAVSTHASFDESAEENEADGEPMPVESYAEKLSDRKSLKKEVPTAKESAGSHGSTKRLHPVASSSGQQCLSPPSRGSTKTVAAEKEAGSVPKKGGGTEGSGRVVFSLGPETAKGEEGRTPLAESRTSPPRTNGSVKTGSNSFIGQLRSIRSNLHEMLTPKVSSESETKAVGKTSTVAVPFVKETTVSSVAPMSADREARRLRRYRRRSDCESFRDLVQKMENLSRGVGNCPSSYGANQTYFTSGAVVVPPCHRKNNAEVAPSPNTGNTVALLSLRTRTFDKQADSRSFNPDPKPYSVGHGQSLVSQRRNKYETPPAFQLPTA